MKLTDIFKKANEQFTERLDIYQKKLDAAQAHLNSRFQNPVPPKQNKLARHIIKTYYSDYPEVPYISDDRGEEWLEMASLFPKHSIIPKSMMTRFADGLLPGHAYMLYWLGKYTNKRVPVYFEYKYGINFEKEKVFLFNNGLLDTDSKPTALGEEVIKRHYEVIERHTPPKPDRSIEGITKQILASRDQLIRNGFSDYIFMSNSGCCDICAALNGAHFPLSKLTPGVYAPPMHDKCRCSIAAWLDSAEYEAWMDYLDRGGSTAEWERIKKKFKR